MLKEKSSGCRLKAFPHIQNRLRTLKKAWQIVYDMVYGSNISGFGWDPDRQVVTAEDPVWDAYIKVKKQAGNFRNKHLPHFEKMTFIWGKDRATGRNAQLPTKVVDEVNAEIETEQAQDDIPAEEVDNIAGASELPQESHSAAKRRRRNGRDAADVLAAAMNNSSDKLERGLLKVAETMCTSFINIRQESRKIDSARDLYKELLKIDGLTVQEMNRAHVVLAGNEILMYGLPEVPDEFKAQWICDLI